MVEFSTRSAEEPPFGVLDRCQFRWAVRKLVPDSFLILGTQGKIVPEHEIALALAGNAEQFVLYSGRKEDKLACQGKHRSKGNARSSLSHKLLRVFSEVYGRTFTLDTVDFPVRG